MEFVVCLFGKHQQRTEWGNFSKRRPEEHSAGDAFVETWVLIAMREGNAHSRGRDFDQYISPFLLQNTKDSRNTMALSRRQTLCRG
jgi:hypothetical protein